MERERQREMKKAVSGRASELSYSCYDLSSLKSFSLSSFSFLVSAPFPFTLRASGGFYLSNEPLILSFFFFCSYLIRSGWKAIFVILSSWRLHLYVRTMAELSGVKCLCGDFGRRWWKKWTQGSE